MTSRAGRRISSWQWLLFLFSVAGFIEAAFWGQMGAFTPLRRGQVRIKTR